MIIRRELVSPVKLHGDTDLNQRGGHF